MNSTILANSASTAITTATSLSSPPTPSTLSSIATVSSYYGPGSYLAWVITAISCAARYRLGKPNRLTPEWDVDKYAAIAYPTLAWLDFMRRYFTTDKTLKELFTNGWLDIPISSDDGTAGFVIMAWMTSNFLTPDKQSLETGAPMLAASFVSFSGVMVLTLLVMPFDDMFQYEWQQFRRRGIPTVQFSWSGLWKVGRVVLMIPVGLALAVIALFIFLLFVMPHMLDLSTNPLMILWSLGFVSYPLMEGSVRLSTLKGGKSKRKSSRELCNDLFVPAAVYLLLTSVFRAANTKFLFGRWLFLPATGTKLWELDQLFALASAVALVLLQWTDRKDWKKTRLWLRRKLRNSQDSERGLLA